jgi:outer membrane lipoprotein-sorting protein
VSGPGSGPDLVVRSAGGAGRWPLRLGNGRTRRWPLAGLATAAVLAVALLGVAVWVARPPPVSAAEIVRKAQAAAADAAASGIRGFERVEETVTTTDWGLSPSQRAQGVSGVSRSVRHVWFRAPDQWRQELRFTELPGQGPDPAPRVTVADGRTVWYYDGPHNALQISLGQFGGIGQGDYGLYGAGSLDAALRRAGECYRPRLTGEERVAGRPAYVVSMGPTTCPSAAAAEMNGPLTLWLDEETFFVLKAVLRDTADARVVQTRQVTSIRYNPDLPDALFTFTPPPGATVLDNRPRPAPTAAEFDQQLAALARQADFPLFVPRGVPGGLVPREPRLDGQVGLRLEYVPPEEAATDAPAQRRGLSIVQRPATAAALADATEKAEPVSIPAGKAWLRRGGPNASSAAVVLRDGTLVWVGSLGLAADELVRVAASLEPVPGGHAPLPEPTRPALADIRRRVSMPVFVPTWLPEPLTPEPPVAGEGQEASVRITYHAPDGSIALRVLNGPAGCCLDDDPRKGGQAVALPNGLTAHFLNMQPEYGGPILWWEQEGAYVALSGPRRTRDELVKIATSVSKTADLGLTESVDVRPTATPIPPPPFALLRPGRSEGSSSSVRTGKILRPAASG